MVLQIYVQQIEPLIAQVFSDLPLGSVHRLVMVDIEFHEQAPATDVMSPGAVWLFPVFLHVVLCSGLLDSVYTAVVATIAALLGTMVACYLPKVLLHSMLNMVIMSEL